MSVSRFLVFLVGCLSLPALPLRAAETTEFATPSSWVLGDASPVLSITDGPTILQLSRLDIERLPLHQTVLETKWELSGAFQGVLLSDLLASVGLGSVERVRLRAVDEYVVTVERREIAEGHPLLATRLNGRPLGIEGKGPLMLLWPRNAEEMVAGTASSAKWIWSVTEIGERR